MDNSLGVKLRPNVSSRSHALRDPVAVRETAETELAPTKAVSATSDGGAKNREQRPREESLARDVLIDPKSAEALLRAAELPAGQPEASPNEVLMRRRAYGSAPQTGQPADAPGSTGDPHADIEV
jgi:hypothetical protein